jgi:hypothetical protein
MKTLRLAIISLVAVASASASFAGPGLQYWNARRADRARAAEKPAAVAPANTKCESMIVKQGKRTSTVKCDSAVSDTAKCKAACGS